MNTAPQTTNQDTPSLWHFVGQFMAILWKDWPRDMNVTGLDNTGNYSITGICPHCRRSSVFIPVTENHKETLTTSQVLLTSVMQCQGCRRLILGLVRHWSNSRDYFYEAHYPTGMPDESLDKSIPDDVAHDFKEAIRCHYIKAYRACVVMCRQAIETSVTSHNAQGKTLVQQIDDLASKGIITAPLKDFAHEIRLTANAGAHADRLIDIKESDAESIMEFTREYLDHVYVMPAKLQARRKPAQP